MTHTQGPWRATFAYDDPAAMDLDGRLVAMAVMDEDAPQELDAIVANARLIAAAPELLDRLKSMVSGAECECDTADEEHPMCDICWSRQVIAKAEGRSE